jgi:hypothetical protein
LLAQTPPDVYGVDAMVLDALHLSQSMVLRGSPNQGREGRVYESLCERCGGQQATWGARPSEGDNYHTARDSPEKLSYAAVARVARGLQQALAALAG